MFLELSATETSLLFLPITTEQRVGFQCSWVLFQLEIAKPEVMGARKKQTKKKHPYSGTV